MVKAAVSVIFVGKLDIVIGLTMYQFCFILLEMANMIENWSQIITSERYVHWENRNYKEKYEYNNVSKLNFSKNRPAGFIFFIFIIL